MRSFHPSIPSAGNSVSATLIRQLIDEIRASRIIPGPGVKVRRTPQGTHVSVSAEAGKRQNQTSIKPWTFLCKEDPKTHEKVGGWYNQTLQFGMEPFHADDPKHGGILGGDAVDDGTYYLKADVSKTSPQLSGALEIVKSTEGRFDGNTMFFKIGTVENGKQKDGPHISPVFYKYLD